MSIQDDIPKSRITLTYRTTIEGEPADVSLPLRLLLLGDFTALKGEKAETKQDLEVRPIISVNGSNIDEVMQQLDLSVDFAVPSAFDGSKQEINYKFESMKDFGPDAIAKALPDVQALMEMRRMLTQLQSDLANQRSLGKELKKLANDETVRTGLIDELSAANFADFTIPELPSDDPEPAAE